MGELNIISKRIKEVQADSESLRAKLAENDRELAELETAAKVLARLTGGDVSHSSPVVEGSATKPKNLPTMPQLIVMALKHEGRPLEPREITEVIRNNWWPDADTKKIGSIVWRLHNRNDIHKVEGTSTYRLPQMAEPPDEKLGSEASRGSLFNTVPEAQGDKAPPGGGT